MKIPPCLTVLFVLTLICPFPATKTEAGPTQSESEFTLVSADGEPLALISDYSLDDNQFCFRVTNLTTSRIISQIGPDFALGAIKVTGVSQSGSENFFLSPDRQLTYAPESGLGDIVNIDVAFALIDGAIPPGQSTRFCVTGEFKNHKAKNIAKNLLVIAIAGQREPCLAASSASRGAEAAGSDGACAVNLDDVVCGTCNTVCAHVTGGMAPFTYSWEIIDGSFSPAPSPDSACVQYSTTSGAVFIKVTVTSADGTMCTATGETDCISGLTGVLGGRG